MANDGDHSAQLGARFTAEGTMKVDPQGVYATPSDRATVTVSLEFAGEVLDRFRSFVGRGYPQVPHSEPPTNAGSFEDLRVEVTLRWPPFVEQHVRAYQTRLQQAADELALRLEELPSEASEQQEQRLFDAYENQAGAILDEFDERMDVFEGPPGDWVVNTRWDVAERRYERWVYSATEQLGELLGGEDLVEAEEVLLRSLAIVTEEQNPEQVRQTTAVLCNACGGDVWYARQAEALEGDTESGLVHLDAVNMDTHEIRRLVLRADELRCSRSEDLKALHARLSSELPRPPASPGGAAAEALGFVEEMRENLLDAWEAAEDLGVEEEIQRLRLAVEELSFALASEEMRADEENE